MFNIPTSNNRNLHNARNIQNGEHFIMGEEVQNEMPHYVKNLQGKKVYIPNTKTTFELAQCDAFGRYFSTRSMMEKFGIKELSYSYYDENSNFVLLTYVGNNLTKTEFDASEDDSRLFHVFKQIDKCDVVICNPEGSKASEMFRYIYLAKKDYILSVNKIFACHTSFFTAYSVGKVNFGHNVPKKFWDVANNKIAYPTSMWITSFDNGYEPPFITTFYDTASHEYTKYDNYDAIEVECIKMIPMDYKGIMGVPVTFLPVINTKQFEIVGMAAGNSKSRGFYGDCDYTPHVDDRGGCAILNGERVFGRLLIRFRNN